MSKKKNTKPQLSRITSGKWWNSYLKRQGLGVIGAPQDRQRRRNAAR